MNTYHAFSNWVWLIPILAYTAAFALLIRHLFYQQTFAKIKFIGLSLLAVASHLGLNSIYTLTQGLAVDLFASMSFAGAIIAGYSLATLNIEKLGGLTAYPLAVATLIVNALFDPTSLPPASDQGHLLHIGIALCAYAAICMALIQSLLLWVSNSNLKAHHTSSLLEKLPPVQSMEKLLVCTLWISFFALSLTILSGAIFVDNLFGQKLAHKTFFTLASWMTLGTLLWGRHQRGWRGRRLVKWTWAATLMISLGFIGTKIVLEFLITG